MSGDWSARELRIAIEVCRRLARSLPEEFMRDAAARAAVGFMDELDDTRVPSTSEGEGA